MNAVNNPKLLASINQNKSKILLSLIIGIFLVIYSLISFVNHYLFRTNALDLGMFNHAIYSFSHIKMNYFTLNFWGPELSYFGDHFSPIVFLFSPFYYLFGSYTLLVIQIVFVLFGGYGIYKYACLQITESNTKFLYIPLLILVQFLGIWGIFSALSFDFHTNIVAAMMVPWLVYYYEKNNKAAFLLFFPLFKLLKELFGDKISFLLCIFFSFSPIVFRMSMLAMSEIPYLFFVILSINALLKGLTEKKTSWVFIAGLLMSIAGGIRYESWILGVFVIINIAYFKAKKEAILFALTFILIPTYWILSSFIYTNDLLNSFNWAINLPEENSIKSIDSLLRRIWWYPLSLMFAFGPIAFFFFIKELKNYKLSKISISLFLIFVIFFIIWLINSLRGSLLLQHRFSITLFLLSFPFIGYYFKRNKNKIVAKTLIFSLSAFLFAFIYSSKGARPIPRLLTKDAQKVSNVINNNITSNSGFICDFWNWETTYYLPFSSGLKRDKIEIIDSNDKIENIKEKVATIISANHSGVILVNKNNSLYKILIRQRNNYRCEFKKVNLVLESIFENESIICFKYQTIANTGLMQAGGDV